MNMSYEMILENHVAVDDIREFVENEYDVKIHSGEEFFEMLKGKDPVDALSMGTAAEGYGNEEFDFEADWYVGNFREECLMSVSEYDIMTYLMEMTDESLAEKLYEAEMFELDEFTPEELLFMLEELSVDTSKVEEEAFKRVDLSSDEIANIDDEWTAACEILEKLIEE